MIRSFIAALAISLGVADLAGSLAILFWDKGSLASFEVGFLGMLMVASLSFLGTYKHVLEASREEALQILSEEKSAKYEDPYDLFDEDEKGLPGEDSKECKKPEAVVESPKKRRFSLKNFLLGVRSSLSWLRLVGYGVFVVAILILIKNNLLHPPSLLIGVVLSMLGIATSLLLLKRENPTS